MASNSKLIPTPVVDKNGRTTTVHKLADSSAANTDKKLPSPALKRQTPIDRASTPLAPLAPLTYSQHRDFCDWYRPLSALKSVALSDEFPELDPDIESLAWHVTHKGQADHSIVATLLDNHIVMTERPAAAVLGRYAMKVIDPIGRLKAFLRVAERIGSEAPAITDSTLPNLIAAVMNGYCYRAKPQDRVQVTCIDTQEALDAFTAVTLFIHNAHANQLHHQTRSGEFADSEGRNIHGEWMTNRTLDAYLRENPREVHYVIEYVSTRKPGTSAEETRTMLQQIAEIKENGALGEGWL